MKKILLLGAGGLMGRHLANQLPKETCGWQVFGCRRAELDIADAEKSLRTLEEFRPDLVVNAAAFCRMEECESNPAYSKSVNAEAPAWWAKACHERSRRFVHLSTDYVFGGGRSTPYTEEDPPRPLSMYARHKREAELAVLEFPGHAVLRLAWIFGMGGSTFMSRIPGLLLKDEVLKVATGRIGGCLYAGYGAGRLSMFLKKMPDLTEGGGLYHLTHRGAVTWLDFAEECKKQMLQKGFKIRNREVVLVPPGEHEALRAGRPDYSVLDLRKTEALLGESLISWQEGLDAYLEEIVKR